MTKTLLSEAILWKILFHSIVCELEHHNKFSVHAPVSALKGSPTKSEQQLE